MNLLNIFAGNRSNGCLRVLLSICCFCCASCSTEDQSEDQHLEHVVPAHKPATFEEAVTQLRERRDQVQLKATSDRDPQELAELGDIIRWLPDIAADSELLRPDWEQVQRHSIRLEELHRQLISNVDSEQDVTDWQEIMGGLEKLVPAASEDALYTNSASRPSVDE
ncbi:MAG: hypothetical protein KDA93_06800 [Planctomycetaceae bacterium]|nr:hypothetical protein [Planctomycetaceae bacterium]